MENYKKLYAPEINQYEQYHSSDRINESTRLTEQSAKLYEMILVNIQKIKPTSQDGNIWELWFKAERGSLDDFGNYEELHEDGAYDTYEQFVEAYESYDKEEYWFKLCVVIDEGYSALIINDSKIIAINPNQSSGFPVDMDELFSFLNGEIEKIIDKVSDGTYNAYLNDNLPYEYRHGGIIRRQRLWELASDKQKYDMGILTQEDIIKFTNLCQNIELASDNRIAQMTAGMYFEFCSYCYRSALYKELDGKRSSKCLNVTVMTETAD